MYSDDEEREIVVGSASFRAFSLGSGEEKEEDDYEVMWDDAHSS